MKGKYFFKYNSWSSLSIVQFNLGDSYDKNEGDEDSIDVDFDGGSLTL